MKEEEFVHKIRCFICGQRVDTDDIVVMSFNEDDMVCVCKVHVKFRYPEGAFDMPVMASEGSA